MLETVVEKKANLQTFGQHVFSTTIMEKVLPRPVFDNLLLAQQGRSKILPEYADIIASAMKEWAVSQGATHYCHLFQPLTGATAEKHDSFLEWYQAPVSPYISHHTARVVEKLSGSQLLQGEPDASSFPSGGLRSTYEARGYTGWDPTTAPFVWKAGGTVTLFIPSVFFSWTGDVLDTKIPLLRSMAKLNEAALRLTALCGHGATRVFPTLGWEQEYFIVDKALADARPDLRLLGATVFGAAAAKGQEMEDHYFGSIKPRILEYMNACEELALKLGIPVKTRHNEVAPAQHELACLYEPASVAVDHNQLMMVIQRHVAHEHGLECLFHEKPFARVNGSGKHANWSLATDTGLNLLDPGDTPESNMLFLLTLTAVLDAIHEHGGLLRASIGSASNDMRLGGNEAPPAIISVFLGEALEALLDQIAGTYKQSASWKKRLIDLGTAVKHHALASTDRNRTSPFAFTGNKFEFRAVGASASLALPITVLNSIVAKSMNALADEIQRQNGDTAAAILTVLARHIAASKPIRFGGDNYSKAWRDEAQKRGLPMYFKAREAFSELTAPSTLAAFEGVLTKRELESLQEVLKEQYEKTKHIEHKLMVDLVSTRFIPAAQKELSHQYKALVGQPTAYFQKARFERLSTLTEKALLLCEELLKSDEAISAEETAKVLREAIDAIETLVNDDLWPLPKYSELLFQI